MSSALDTVVGIRILKLLSTPIKKSKAFELGIIDDQGKKLRNPTSGERQYYTFLNRFVFKVQYALTKSPNMYGKRLLSFAAAMALLREYKETDDEIEIMSLLEMHMEDEKVQQQARLLESNVLSFKNYIDEMNGVGGGAIAGVGIGPQGEPGVDPRLMPLARRKKKKKDANSK
tara:strand:- start:541 stop:1059 length:519 start_codon:yes stop_codon:yes gene_type:complete